MVRNPVKILLLCAVLSLVTVCQAKSKLVLIVNSDPGDRVMQEAASRLKMYLQKTYPSLRFVGADASVGDVEHVLLGVDSDLSREAYQISHTTGQCHIRGGSALGVLHGVTDLLEQIGWQFYLSYELAPAAPSAWNVSSFDVVNTPLQDKRIVFNWHNFLSGCTGWDYPQWQKWVEQASKMKFNTIMVHAYANNPMQPFAYNGQHKAMGYLSTTQQGRDWGTQHVNDVRRLQGGRLFPTPVFGAAAAQVEEAHKSLTAVALIQKVFRYAKSLGMEICYAMDMDTWMANPQNIIKTLPREALLAIGKHQVVNPEHVHGYPYYRAQITSLLTHYPEITQFAFWTRRPGKRADNGSIWQSMTPDMFPVAWKRQYETILQDHPEFEESSQTSGVFAVSKLAEAVEKCFQELKPEVELCYGSWGFDYTVLADLFFPPSYGLIPLDYSIALDDAQTIERLMQVGRDRTLYPIVWAHHDDHRYNGRPYVPYENFNSLLKDMNAEGFGIIHWKTHPLDLYFTNTSRQMWKNTHNESYRQSVDNLAHGLTVASDPAWNSYLQLWYTQSPMFGRETTDSFLRLDHPYTIDGHCSALDAVDKARERLARLKQVDQTHLTVQGKKTFDYHQAMEQFYISFFNNHYHAHQATTYLAQGQLDKARDHAQRTDPTQSIRMYAELIEAREATRGELGIVVSLNLRWWPDYIDLYQQLRLAPVRISYQPTSHDPLSQGAGHYSFLMDADQALWLAQGERELNLSNVVSTKAILSVPQDAYLSISDEVCLPLHTMRQNPLSAGPYQLTLITPQHSPVTGRVKLICRDTETILWSRQISHTQWGGGMLDLDVAFSGKKATLTIEPYNCHVNLAGIRITPR